MTDPANWPNGDGSGKSPAYGAYAAPVEELLNTTFEGALKNWEIGPFAAWVGKTSVFNELDLQWDFAISLPGQHLTRRAGAAGGSQQQQQQQQGPAAGEGEAQGRQVGRSGSGCSSGSDSGDVGGGGGTDRGLSFGGAVALGVEAGSGSSSSSCGSLGSLGGGGGGGGGIVDVRGNGVAQVCGLEEDIPVDEQWSLVVWLKPGERGTAVDLPRFVAVVDRLASPAFARAAGAGGGWDIFLSHYQGNAGNTVMSLKALLESAAPGLRCWLDKDEDATEAGMRRGVQGSKYYLLFLTQGVLTRPFVQLEAREALAQEKPVILVHETDPRFGAAASFQEYLNEAPPELRPLFSLANSIPWYREEEFRAVSIRKILQAAGRF